MKKPYLIIVILIGLALSFNIAKDVFAFAKSKLIKIECVNFEWHDIIYELNGKVISESTPIYSPAEGKLEFLVKDFSYVDKNTPIARIKGESEEVEIFSQISGFFTSSVCSKYYDSLSKINKSEISDFAINKISTIHNIKTGQVIGTVITNQNYLIAIEKKNLVFDLKNIKLILSKGTNLKITPVKVFEEENYLFILLDSFLPEIYYNDKFMISSGEKFSLKLSKEEIIDKNGEKGILIVNGNTVSFIPMNIINSWQEIYGIPEDENFSSFKYFLVVKTPKFLHEGEFVGGF